MVILAAGLDTRTFRLDWVDGMRVFEIELPHVLGFKDDVLARHRARLACQRQVVPAALPLEEWLDPDTWRVTSELARSVAHRYGRTADLLTDRIPADYFRCVTAITAT